MNFPLTNDGFIAALRPFRWPVPWLVALAVAVALSLGLDFEIQNQNQYLLTAVAALEPGTFASDWFTTATTDYHARFSGLLVLLGTLGPLQWTLTLLNTLLNGFAVVVVYRLVRHALDAAPALWVTAAIAGIFIVGKTESVAGTYLLESYGQPSVMAAIFLLFASERFVAGRLLQSGVALAIAGYLHLNFLVLGGLLFGVAHLVQGGAPSVLFRRALAQFTLATLLLLASLPTLLTAAGGGPESGLALDVYLHYRVPHHYLPQIYWPQLVQFLGWQLLACVGAGPMLRRSPAGRRWVVLYASGVFLIALLHQATTWVFIPQVALLFVSRLAPLVNVLGQALFLVSAWRAAAGEGADVERWRSPWTWLLIVAGLCLIAVGLCIEADKPPPSMAWIVLGVGALASLLVAWRQRGGSETWRITIPVAAMLAAVALLAVNPGSHRFKLSTALFGRPDSAEQQLYAWAASTPLDAVFAIPPYLQDFRLQSRRAVVVDWKSVPGLPVEQLEWYRRLQLVTGLERVSSPTVAEEGYARMTASRAEAIRQEFGAEYAVLRVRAAQPVPDWCDRSFVNKRYVACRLEPRG